MSINGGGDQSAVSKTKKELLALTQRLLDEQQQLRLLDGGETEGREEVSPSATDHQLMETAAAAKKKKEKAAAAKNMMKKKRNKRNKAAAKHKGTKRMSRLGGGIISLLMMAVTFGSIMKLSHIPQSDGSTEGNKAPPTLPPSASTSLRQRKRQSSDNIMSPTSPSSVSPFSASVVQAPLFSPADVSNPPMNSSPASVSPLAAVVQAPIFSPATVSNPPTYSRTDVSNTPTTCFDTPNWEDGDGDGCKWYEENDTKGCPNLGSSYEGDMVVANDNCCFCGGGSHTLSPTTSSTASSSPTKSATPSSSPKPSASPTQTCLDTRNWEDGWGSDCKWYKENDEPGCPGLGSYNDGGMGVANDNCCYCGKEVSQIMQYIMQAIVNTTFLSL
jgi:hypothetical protein